MIQSVLEDRRDEYSNIVSRLRRLHENINVIDKESTDGLLSDLNVQFEILEEKLPIRISKIQQDLQVWSEYNIRLEEMCQWLNEKKTYLELEKPISIEDIEKQTKLLEVSYLARYLSTACFIDLSPSR